MFSSVVNTLDIVAFILFSSVDFATTRHEPCDVLSPLL